MPPFTLHPNFILKEGLEFGGFDSNEQNRLCLKTKLRYFKSHFGRHPLHLARVFRDLKVANLMTEDEAKNRSSFYGFLLGNYLLKCYEDGDIFYSRFKRFGIGRDECSTTAWDFIGRLGSLKKWKIKCPEVWPAKLGASCDGTHARRNEPRDPDVRRNPKDYSQKNNCAGLSRQIVLSLWTNDVWYSNEGDEASIHDMTAIRDEFIAMVPDGCRVIADSGYTGKSELEKKIFAVSNPLDSDEVKQFKADAKSRQESFNSRMKVYKCLQIKHHHSIDKLKKCFAAIVCLLQYAIEATSEAGEPFSSL